VTVGKAMTGTTSTADGQASLLAELETVRTTIDNTRLRLEQLLEARTALFDRGVAAGVSKAALGRAGGMTGEGVIKALKRSDDARNG